jgi:hypothetical protein
MGLDERIRKLEGSQPEPVCPRCHDPQIVAFVRGEPCPEPCPACHKTAMFVVQVESEKARQYVELIASGQLPKPMVNTEEVPE